MPAHILPHAEDDDETEVTWGSKFPTCPDHNLPAPAYKLDGSPLCLRCAEEGRW